MTQKQSGTFPKSARFAIQMKDDRWVKDYDPNAFGGRGHVTITGLVGQAKKFKTLNEAVAFFSQSNQSGQRPFITESVTLARVR